MNENCSILEDKQLMSAVITCVMSGKQSERDDACRKLQGHILAVEAERNAREAECEKLSRMVITLRDSLWENGHDCKGDHIGTIRGQCSMCAAYDATAE